MAAGVVHDADDAGRPFVARRLEPELLDERGSVAAAVTGAGRVCGTSASSEPNVTSSSTPSSCASSSDEPGERPPAEVRLDAEQDHGVAVDARESARGGTRSSGQSILRVSARPRATRAGGSPGSRRSSPGRSPRSAPHPTASRGKPRAERRALAAVVPAAEGCDQHRPLSRGRNETFSSDIPPV